MLMIRYLLLLLLLLLLAMEAAPPWVLLSKGLVWWQCLHLNTREAFGGGEEDEDWQTDEERDENYIRIRIRISMIRVRIRVGNDPNLKDGEESVTWKGGSGCCV